MKTPNVEVRVAIMTDDDVRQLVLDTVAALRAHEEPRPGWLRRLWKALTRPR